MAESFFDRMFGKKSKKDEKPAPAPAPTPAPAADAANGLKFLANPKKATNKRIEDAEKAAGMKCGGRVKKMAFGGPVSVPPRPMAGNRAAMVQSRLQGSPLQTASSKFGGMGTQPVIRLGADAMKKGGSVRGGGCAAKGIGKGKMR